jgi:Sulfotransferase domain
MRILLPLFLLHGFCVTAMGTSPATDHTPSSKAKVFVIGLSKTGTTSLGDALEVLNYTRSGWLDIWSRYLSHQALLPTPNLRPLISMSEEYEAFEDLPWCLPQVYTEMSRRYPDAKFILSLRRNEHVWLESMRKHAKAKLWEGHNTIYGGYQVDDNEKVFLKMYLDHIRDVRAFFQTEGMKGRGLEFVIDQLTQSDQEKWQKLVGFLGIDLKDGFIAVGHFPKSNGNHLWSNSDPLGFVWMKYRLMFWIERGIVEVGSLAWMCTSMLL